MPRDDTTHPVNRNACRRIAERNPLLRAARYYTLQLDLPIFPLQSNSKIPATSNGFKDATTHELAVCQWWKDTPSANLGLPTGQRSGLFVLDVDPKNGGLDSIAKLPEIPPTRTARTPSGGFHYFFRWQAPLGNSAGKLGPGLDTRGEGGYVVVPPSIIDGKRYEWMNEDDPADVPEWLLQRLLPPPSTPPRNPIERRLVSASQLVGDPRRAKAATTLIERASDLAEGERNSGTFRISAALREVASTEEEWEEYRARLLDVLPYGNGYGPAFTEAEAERTIVSAEARAVLGAWEPSSPLDTAGQKATKEDGGLEVTWGADIEVSPLQWLWPNYVPLGTFGILAGAPKVGKSAVAVDLAARITTGRPMPDGSEGVKGAALIVAPEDGPDGARVRFEAAGGDLNLFGHLAEPDGSPPSFPEATPKLERIIRTHDVRLVIIDNLEAVAGRKVDMNNPKDATGMLAPLQAVAKRTNATILAINHTRKGATNNPIDAVMGSRKITGVARFVALVFKDPNNEAERLLGIEGNYARETDGTLRFILESGGNGDARGVRVAWHGDGGVSITDVMTALTEDRDSNRAAGRNLLSELLTPGPMPYETIKKHAIERAIPLSTLGRARDDLGVKFFSAEHDKRTTYWHLPGTFENESNPTQD